MAQDRVHGLVSIKSGFTGPASALPRQICPETEREAGVVKRSTASQRFESMLTSPWTWIWEYGETCR